jgi:hypothetical protein
VYIMITIDYSGSAVYRMCSEVSWEMQGST